MSQPGHLSFPRDIWHRLTKLAESRREPVAVLLLTLVRVGLDSLEAAHDERPLVPRRTRHRYTDAD